MLELKREVERLRRRGGALVGELKRNPAAKSEPGSSQRKNDNQSIMDALYRNNTFQALCTLKTAGQLMMWDAIGAAIDAEADRLSKHYRTVQASDQTLGSLTLDPNVNIPDRLKDSRIHLQPAGYFADDTDDDLRAGAFYEEGGALYSRGVGVGTKESKAECAIRFIKNWQPAFQPTRIIDLGCSVGASTTPYAEEFPDAEVHGVELAPGMLRYAHARAESLGLAVHFHQMDAGKLDFDDASVDLVISHNTMHEMSIETQRRMFSESYRVLRPGGLCIHQDVPIKLFAQDAYSEANILFDKWFNGEIFWSDYADNDCEQILKDTGFKPEDLRCEYFAQLDKTIHWYFAAAKKS